MTIIEQAEIVLDEIYDKILAENSYQKFFREKLKKYGVKSPNQLDPEKKKKFFEEIKRDWKKNKK